MATIERALDLATAQYAREGLTSVTDAGVAGGWIGHAPGERAAYQNARERGTLRTRMQVMPVIDALARIGGHSGEADRLGLGAGVRTGWGDHALELGPNRRRCARSQRPEARSTAMGESLPAADERDTSVQAEVFRP
ncbi:hypothetical protein FNH09_23900 [Streptomyces adustus]|uniref:Uncharacterized protein n=1 Tax=Streptomyces adustus TaxID=1609272 RepID=A0A5N8VG07_9ACTN|nr:hypothetical protein [Streptomyces adustus]MPY34180.1 hypothetical protein [Streptomyces adustus]